jgi:hypothetical protein
LRTDNLLAGKLILPFEGRLLAIVLSSATTCLWKSFRRSRTQFRDRPETVRLHPGTGVHLHPGILFGINPEHRSGSSRKRVHLAPESPRYIVLLGESLILIPGGSSACVQLFDSTTRRINSWSFQVGWRADLYDASMEYSDDFTSDMIILRTAPVINGRNITKEYFSLKNDRLRFVRLENDKGALVQNEYVFPNYEIGIIPDAKTVEEWAALLQSEDKADVLSALIFLSGKHIDEPERQLLPGPHESNYVGLYKKLTRSARIHDLVEHLAESENNWVRQAALLVTSKPKVVKH